MPLWRGGRAHRAAIDAGGRDRAEKTAVKAGVAGFNRAVTGVLIQVHAANMGRRGARVSRIPDIEMAAIITSEIREP